MLRINDISDIQTHKGSWRRIEPMYCDRTFEVCAPHAYGIAHVRYGQSIAFSSQLIAFSIPEDKRLTGCSACILARQLHKKWRHVALLSGPPGHSYSVVLYTWKINNNVLKLPQYHLT